MKDFKDLDLIVTYNKVTKLFYIAEKDFYDDEIERSIIGYGNTIEEAYKYTICNMYEKYKQLISNFKNIKEIVSQDGYLKEDLHLKHPRLYLESEEKTIEYEMLIYNKEDNEWTILSDGFFITG